MLLCFFVKLLKIFIYQELISSPLGSKHSQTDSQSESSQSNNQEEPGQSFSRNMEYGMYLHILY